MLDTPQAVRRAAMDLLARREHSRVELERKLAQRGALAEFVAPALDQLQQDGLLSEERFVEVFIRSRTNAGYGPVRLLSELESKGITRECAREALRNSGVDWSAVAFDVWSRKFGSLPEQPKERARQIRFLAYRGFSMDTISRILRGQITD